MEIVWFDVLKNLYQSGDLEKENKTADQRLLDAVAKDLISEDQRQSIINGVEL